MRSKSIILMALLLALFSMGCGSSRLSKDEAAKVNGKVISHAAVDKYVAKLAAETKQVEMPRGEQARQFEMQAVQDLVLLELLLQEADKKGIKIGDNEVDARLAKIKAQYYGGDDGKLEKALKDQHITLKEAKDQLRKSIVIEELRLKVVTDATKITDADIKKYYDENFAKLDEPEQRHLRHMLFKTKEDALKAKAELDGGADPMALAKKVSLDTNTNMNGGDLGWIERGVTSEEFEKVAFGLKPGIWSEPVQTMSGWNIIKVEEIKPGGTPMLEKLKDDIRKTLLAERGDNAWSDWLEKAWEKADMQFAEQYKELAKYEPLPSGHPPVDQASGGGHL